jgi:hypothetical protein
VLSTTLSLFGAPGSNAVVGCYNAQPARRPDLRLDPRRFNRRAWGYLGIPSIRILDERDDTRTGRARLWGIGVERGDEAGTL